MRIWRSLETNLYFLKTVKSSIPPHFQSKQEFDRDREGEGGGVVTV